MKEPAHAETRRRGGGPQWCFGFLPPALAALAACVSPSARPIPAATRVELSVDDLRVHLEALAHDSMQGREAGTIGNERATEYVVRELTRVGLETTTQTVPLTVHLPDQGSLVHAGDAVIRFGDDLLPLRAVGGAPLGGRFNGASVETVYGGRLTSTLIAPDSVRGKVVIFSLPLGGDGRPVPSIVGASGAVIESFRGAAAILIAGLEALPAGAIAFLRQPTMSLATSAPVTRIPGARITTEAAERAMGASFATLRVGARGRPLSGAFGLIWRNPAARARNVIALVRGTDPALRATYVAVGSHTDHVGLSPVALNHDSVFAFNRVLRKSGANEQSRPPNFDQAQRVREIRDSLRAVRPPRRDSIFNGADDDASAVAVALELAEHFVKHPARRSILFVFHTAEEKGLFGAAHFTAFPSVPRDSIIAQVNMDQVSRGGPEDIEGTRPRTIYVLGARRRSPQLGELLERVNSAPEHQFHLDYQLDVPGHPANAFCRSDHYMYARFGIPVVFFSAGWHPDYHMVTDEARYARPEVMFGVASLVRDLVKSLADLPTRLTVTGPPPDPAAPCKQ